MSRENVDALQTVYESWARGDFESGAEIYSADVVWVLSEEFPNSGEYRGIEAMREGFREWLRAWADWKIAAERYIDRGDMIIVLTRYRARGRDSGVMLDQTGAHLWTFRGRKVVRQEVWMDRDRALESVRLQE